MIVARAVGQALAAAGVDHVFGVVGSGNFHVTDALTQGGARFVVRLPAAGVAEVGSPSPGRSTVQTQASRTR